MTDVQTLIATLERAGVIIAEHIEPGRARDAEQTINRLMAVLDTQEVALAMERLNEGFGLRVVK
jgi:hypothetical protein